MFPGMARETYQQQIYKSSTSSKSVDGYNELPRHWAPESLEDEEFSVKSDVWSFGMCVVTMLGEKREWGSL